MDWPKNGYRFLPLVLAMGSIFYLSHQPGSSLSLPEIVNIDKLLHCLAYAVLGLTFLLALPLPWRQQRPMLTGCAVVLFCFFYGATDEWHQSFIPGRYASTADLAADTVGGLLAAVGDWGWQQRRKTKKTRGNPHEPSGVE
jgi:VanZ family protein